MCMLAEERVEKHTHMHMHKKKKKKKKGDKSDFYSAACV